MYIIKHTTYVKNKNNLLFTCEFIIIKIYFEIEY